MLIQTYLILDFDVSIDFFLAACDVEGNFLVVKAYQYTTLLSCMLLDAYVSLFLPCLPDYCVILLTHAFFFGV